MGIETHFKITTWVPAIYSKAYVRVYFVFYKYI